MAFNEPHGPQSLGANRPLRGECQYTSEGILAPREPRLDLPEEAAEQSGPRGEVLTRPRLRCFLLRGDGARKWGESTVVAVTLEEDGVRALWDSVGGTVAAPASSFSSPSLDFVSTVAHFSPPIA